MNKNNKNTVKEILKEIYLLDDSFKENEKELEKIVSKMIEIKPEIKIDENFKNELKKNISEIISEEENFSREKNNLYLKLKNFFKIYFKNFSNKFWEIFWFNNFTKIFWWFIWWAISFAFVMNLSPNFQNNPNQFINPVPEIWTMEVSPMLMKRWIMEEEMMQDFEIMEVEMDLESFSDEIQKQEISENSILKAEPRITKKWISPEFAEIDVINKNPVSLVERNWEFILTVDKNTWIFLMIIDWVINISLISIIVYLVYRIRRKSKK